MALTLERGLRVWVAATIVAFACGSAIVGRILLYGRPARWICLVVLLVLAVAARRGRIRIDAAAGAAALLSAVALFSALWSVDSSLTVARACSFALLLGVAVALAAAGPVEEVRGLLVSIIAGMTVVAAAGLITLLVAHDDAVQAATYEYPVRYRGLGQNPNTMSLLLALGVPLALSFAIEARTIRRRFAAAATSLLFVGSIVAADSRGAMLGALAGSLAVAAVGGGTRRARLTIAAVVVSVFALGLGVTAIPKAKEPPSVSVAREVAPTKRTILTSSGRLAAWRGAIRQVEDRPLAGYGFGTEARVFVNRYAGFDSQLPENSYIGISLQLGLVGLVLVLAVALAPLARVAVAARRLDPARRAMATACAGAATAALVAAVTQSYLLSVGNVATATTWISLFLLWSLTR
jgi:exopolysaccharide production protein ExoQ